MCLKNTKTFYFLQCVCLGMQLDLEFVFFLLKNEFWKISHGLNCVKIELDIFLAKKNMLGIVSRKVSPKNEKKVGYARSTIYGVFHYMLFKSLGLDLDI